MGRNLLFLRLENIADLFDYQSTQTLTDTGVYVDVPQLAKNFFYQANGASAQLSNVNIQEMQITGIQS